MIGLISIAFKINKNKSFNFQKKFRNLYSKRGQIVGGCGSVNVQLIMHTYAVNACTFID